jgi:hypothetical protein
VSAAWADGRITVSSAIPGDVYLGGIKQGSVNPGDTFVLTVQDPGIQTVEVRGANSNLIHREEVSLDPAQNEQRVVQAFSGIALSGSEPIAAAPPPTPAPIPTDAITREEMHAAVANAAQRAKSEALAEEAARRRRAQQRGATNSAIGHIVAVEGRRLPSGVKNMERVKLLSELLPVFGNRR